MGAPLHEWTRDEIATRILNGENLFIYRNRVIRVPPSWLSRHPGGELAILHFIGRDATDEVDAFHADETLKRVEKYVVGYIKADDAGWEPLLPPIASGWIRKIGSDGVGKWMREAQEVRSPVESQLSPSSQVLLVKKGSLVETDQPSLQTILPSPSSLQRKIQAQHSAAYKELHDRIKKARLYETPYLTGYGPEVIRYCLLACISAFAYWTGWFFVSAAALGFFWQQLSFTAHDLGHMGVTHDWKIDRLIAIFIADFLGGLSIGWWVDNHNIHHLVTNHPSHDPDIEHLPFFAISVHFLKSLYSSYYKRIMVLDAPARFFLSVQHKLFYIIMSLARFNLYANSYSFLFKNMLKKPKANGGRWSWWLEIVGLVAFWTWYSMVLRGTGSWQKGLMYLLVSHVAASPLHVQIVLSHFSRSTADLGPTESFPDRQLRTTADVICPEHLAFIHGGLHLQVTHHLFPRLPRHNLKKASKLVKEFAKEQGLEYYEFGFGDGNKEVRDVLKHVAEQVKVMGLVAEAEVQEALKETVAA